MREFRATWLILYSVLVLLLKFVGEIFRLNFVVLGRVVMGTKGVEGWVGAA